MSKMINVTEEVNEKTERQRQTQTPQMPTVKEFTSAKMTEGFNFLGKKFGDGKHYLELRKELVSAKANKSKLAQRIGNVIIEQINSEQYSYDVPSELVVQVQEVESYIKELEGKLKNG